MLRTRRFDNTPAHRLVAAELELRWNRALERVTELEGRIEKHLGETPTTAPTSPEQFATLAVDLKAVWRDPTTDVRLKKRIVRELIREVIADLDEQDGEIILVVHWMGGVHNAGILMHRNCAALRERRRMARRPADF